MGSNESIVPGLKLSSLAEILSCQDVQDQLLYLQKNCTKGTQILQERCCGQPMCLKGTDPKSKGCGSCLSDFGRKATEPFVCKLCRHELRLSSGLQLAIAHRSLH